MITTSHPTAARLLNVADRRLTELLDEGLIALAPGCRTRRRYEIGAIEFLLGRRLTPDDWQRVHRERQPRLAAVKRYNDRIRGFSPIDCPAFLRAPINPQETATP